MKQTTREKLLNTGIELQHLYSDIVLGGVVTLPEAAYLWGKSLDQVKWACKTKKLHYRKSLSGATILISVWSLAELWKLPDEMTLWDCFLGEIDVTSDDAFNTVVRKGASKANGSNT